MYAFHYITFILIFIIVCIIIKRINYNNPVRSINNFSNLATGEMVKFISDTIDSTIDSKFNNLRLERTNGSSDGDINILINDTPLGHISYFNDEPSKEHCSHVMVEKYMPMIIKIILNL